MSFQLKRCGDFDFGSRKWILIASSFVHGAVVKDLSPSEKNHLNVAVNDAVRHIFGFNGGNFVKYM